MKINPKAWPLITQVVSASTLTILCMILYKNGLVPIDTMLLLGNAVALWLVNFIKNLNVSYELPKS